MEMNINYLEEEMLKEKYYTMISEISEDIYCDYEEF